MVECSKAGVLVIYSKDYCNVGLAFKERIPGRRLEVFIGFAEQSA
jgi:hypothetical protein